MFAKRPIAKSQFPAVASRYEDFVALHSNATSGGIKMDGKDNDPSGSFFAAFSPNGIHSNGVFLPWHRYFITVWEEALQKECGWDQALPYW
jgi:tyrosinase